MSHRACSLILLVGGFLFAACQPASQSSQAVLQCLDFDPAPVELPSGSARIGSDVAYIEEAPARTVQLGGFDIDATEVTNRQFASFVAATEYVTLAEQKPDAVLIPPNAPAYLSHPGAAVFQTPSPQQPSWWAYVPGADWRHPKGPQSSIAGKENFPVVQIAWADALAYAKWAGRRLPSEAEWEYAANAGAKTLYPWGEDQVPNGQYQANTWQGLFPLKDQATDGFGGLAPVGCFQPNAFGLYDMIGNSWEWTTTPYLGSGRGEISNEAIYTVKGGSFLCADNYCRRDRSTARQPQEAGLGSNHIGFRTIGELPQ
ncbi:MAG: hypothetical protein COA47_15660 [Robiginitomaculum sp.]|nr:MAG: hypothetical protein COA47_15660 [Robiginitomaculum sp.]